MALDLDEPICPTCSGTGRTSRGMCGCWMCGGSGRQVNAPEGAPPDDLPEIPTGTPVEGLPGIPELQHEDFQGAIDIYVEALDEVAKQRDRAQAELDQVRRIVLRYSETITALEKTVARKEQALAESVRVEDLAYACEWRDKRNAVQAGELAEVVRDRVDLIWALRNLVESMGGHQHPPEVIERWHHANRVLDEMTRRLLDKPSPAPGSLLRPPSKAPTTPTPEQVARGAEVMRGLKEPPTRGEPCRHCGRSFAEHRPVDTPKACPGYERPPALSTWQRARAEEKLTAAEQKLEAAGARPMTEPERAAAIRREVGELAAQIVSKRRNAGTDKPKGDE